jgi:hypothetical protein
MSARLPDLIVVGAPKAGTTTISRWLRVHPQVAFSDKKELQFFDKELHRGLGWYLDQLPQDPGDRVVAEATPTYLSEPGVAQAVAEALPQARFVAVLREPVARAWSNFWFFRQLGLESRSWARTVRESSDAPTQDDQIGYLWRGRYAEQLATWERLVGRERLHVVLFDDLVREPEQTYAEMCRFAGIEQIAPPSTESVNPTGAPRSVRLQRVLQSPDAGSLRRRLYLWNARGSDVPKLTFEARARVAPRFEDANAALADWLGRPLPAAWSLASTADAAQGAHRGT